MLLFAHADGSVTNYSYNADGIRTGKQYLDAGGGELGTVKYTLDGNKIVAENRNGTNIYQRSGVDVSNNATHIANINPFRYRGYYYDTETGFYYLQSRYYDPVVGRFLNADAFVSTGQGIVGNNLFAYCNNNPVIYADYKGFSVASVLDETIRMSAVSAGGGGVSAALGGLSPAGGIVGTIIVIAFLSSNGISYNSSFDDNDIVSGECRSVFSSDYEYYPDYYGVYTAPTSRAASKAIAKEENVVEKSTSYPPDRPVYFPLNPKAFKPLGLVVIFKFGTKNGGFYIWLDPYTRKEVFRWDRNINGSNVPHYHVLSEGHYYPGDLVPEPYASIYFKHK